MYIVICLFNSFMGYKKFSSNRDRNVILVKQWDLQFDDLFPRVICFILWESSKFLYSYEVRVIIKKRWTVNYVRFKSRFKPKSLFIIVFK